MSGSPGWVRELAGSVVVCDAEGRIIEMNQRAQQAFADQGGAELIGSNLLDCHDEPSRTAVQQLLAHPRVNVYTVQRGSQNRLVCHVPWFENGRFAGLAEMVVEAPGEIPRVIRAP